MNANQQKTADKPVCAGCRWFSPFIDGGPGECRKNAPTTLKRHEPWPQVRADDWCGAHTPAKPASGALC